MPVFCFIVRFWFCCGFLLLLWFFLFCCEFLLLLLVFALLWVFPYVVSILYCCKFSIFFCGEFLILLWLFSFVVNIQFSFVLRFCFWCEFQILILLQVLYMWTTVLKLINTNVKKQQRKQKTRTVIYCFPGRCSAKYFIKPTIIQYLKLWTYFLYKQRNYRKSCGWHQTLLKWRKLQD